MIESSDVSRPPPPANVAYDKLFTRGYFEMASNDMLNTSDKLPSDIGPPGKDSKDSGISSIVIRKQMNGSGRAVRPHSVHGSMNVGNNNSPRNVLEVELLREVIFAFQGLNGRILVQDPDNDNRYTISPQFELKPSTKVFALRLSNVGWLFNKVNKFCHRISRDQTCGHVMQSFAAALQEEILECYRLITVIEKQLHNMTQCESDGLDDSPFVSLHRLQVWSYEHFYRLKMLAALIETCKHKRGGELANFVYNRMQHGDPQLRNCLTRILNQVI